MRHSLSLITLLWPAALPAAEVFIVESGQPRAEIVIAEQPQRTVRIAAADLQEYVQKISGARLPIVTQPSGAAVKLFVGRSPHTDELGFTAEGLKFGAYRIASGGDWMVFIGDDTDFVPPEIRARNNNDIVSGKLQKAWEAASGGTWLAPNVNMYKELDKLPATLGLPDGAPPPAKGTFLEHWAYDEHGSYNAVCAFLRELGVRWLLPGDLGEVVPTTKTISLPKIEATVRPDFELRQFSAHGPAEVTRWGMRLGVRYEYGANFAHGMSRLATKDFFDAHPEWFAQYGDKRRFEAGKNNHFCYSNPELFEETLRCVRAQFDVYRYDSVSVMPPDAYTSICQCALCKGKDEPARGPRGSLSNHVWDFVNRVAKEIGKTHPGKLVSCCAYGANSLPPTNIDKLEPNVQVVIVGGRRPKSGVSKQNETRALRESWLPKTGRPVIIFENYPLTARGFYLPCFMARTIGSSINATKGISRGEDIWISTYKEMSGTGFFNAFQYYFTARSYWGGPNQDVGALLDEFCNLLFGPAGDAMKALFDYCEVHWQDMETDKAKADAALALFATAKSSVAPDSIEARRIAPVDDFLNGLRKKTALLAQKRGPVPSLRMVGEPQKIVIDGKLDEEFWRNINASARARLCEVQTGRAPAFGTAAMAAWGRDNLYLAIRCDERPGETMNVTATKKGDPALWRGDAVEVLLQTDAHSYYQIAVNPAGSLVDYDRGADKQAWDGWDSMAEVAVQTGDGHWTVEMRIPVTDDENDPLHQVIGRRPSESLPWHINICRQRVRENGSENSALSPTGSPGFHDVMRFAHFYTGRSHQFEADPADTNFVTSLKAAGNLPRAEALKALAALANGPQGSVTALQRSEALKQAAAVARTLKDYARADELAARIPIEAVQKATAMQNLIAQRESPTAIQQFGGEDLARWPFWAAAEGYFARGAAYATLGEKAKSEADLREALALTTDKRLRLQIERMLDRVAKP